MMGGLSGDRICRSKFMGPCEDLIGGHLTLTIHLPVITEIPNARTRRDVEPHYLHGAEGKTLLS